MPLVRSPGTCASRRWKSAWSRRAEAPARLGRGGRPPAAVRARSGGRVGAEAERRGRGKRQVGAHLATLARVLRRPARETTPSASASVSESVSSASITTSCFRDIGSGSPSSCTAHRPMPAHRLHRVPSRPLSSGLWTSPSTRTRCPLRLRICMAYSSSSRLAVSSPDSKADFSGSSFVNLERQALQTEHEWAAGFTGLRARSRRTVASLPRQASRTRPRTGRPRRHRPSGCTGCP